MTTLFNKEEISEWAFYYCRKINDNPEIRKYITHPFYALYYCKFTRNDPEVRKYIKYYPKLIEILNDKSIINIKLIFNTYRPFRKILLRLIYESNNSDKVSINLNKVRKL